MILKNQNFIMYQGDSKKLKVTCTENGSPLSLSGATIKWVMKPNIKKDAFVSKDTSSGITITDNTFTVSLVPVDTKTIRPGRYYHEAEITDGFGNVSTVMVGEVTILESGV